MGYAKIMVAGQIGKVEQLTSQSGNPYVRVSVAVNEKNGSEKITTWFDVLCYQKIGEAIAKAIEYYKPGKTIVVSGKPRAAAFIRKDGQAGLANTIVANEVPEFLT